MKVISGRLKGRKLLFLKDKNIRPTKDIIRESIFDVLRGRVAGERVLDLFAGTGAIGIEAWSEGAKEVVFVESSYHACRVIKKNIESLSLLDDCKIINSDVEKIITSFENACFGMIIADPPYSYSGKRISDIISILINLHVIKKGGFIVIEHREKNKIPVPDGVSLYKEKKYGKVQVSYFKV